MKKPKASTSNPEGYGWGRVKASNDGLTDEQVKLCEDCEKLGYPLPSGVKKVNGKFVKG